MTVYKTDLNAFQIENLETLATFLEDHHIMFDMGSYGATVPERNKCGTVACAAGNGPMAGIMPNPNEEWGEYIDRCLTNEYDELWDWLFSFIWSRYDNTPRGAAARIRYFLAHGVTSEFLNYKGPNRYDPRIYSSYVKN